jgi:hypothetical protein
MATNSDIPASAGPQVPRGIDIVTILVGPKDQTFTIHKNPICAASAFFDRSFNGGFAEGTTQTMTLKEENPDIFSFFIDWLYAQPNTTQDWSLVELVKDG